MGFGSFFSHLVAPVTKRLGPVGTLALLPAIPISQAAANIIDVAGAKVLSATQATRRTSIPVTQPRLPGTAQATYIPPSYGGGYGAPTPQPFMEPFYGGDPWGYSISSPMTAFQPAISYPVVSPYSVSEGPARPAWEDLLSLGALFL